MDEACRKARISDENTRLDVALKVPVHEREAVRSDDGDRIAQWGREDIAPADVPRHHAAVPDALWLGAHRRVESGLIGIALWAQDHIVITAGQQSEAHRSQQEVSHPGKIRIDVSRRKPTTRLERLSRHRNPIRSLTDVHGRVVKEIIA